MKIKILFLTVIFTAVIITGCKGPGEEFEFIQYDRPLPPGELALHKITNPTEIPDFTIACCQLTDLRKAVANSLNYLSKPSSTRFFPCGDVTHDRAVASLEAFAQLLDSGLIGRELNEAIRRQFDVYTSVGCDYKGTVLFTGYYTPIFDGSIEPTERFKYPLYSQPDDLVKGMDGEILGRREKTGRITSYPSRAEIEKSGMLKGSELIWLSDPFEVYIAHVQGSAKIRTPDGELITLGYAANNGHEYHSISKDLGDTGIIPADQMSLSAMIDYFKIHPNEVDMFVSRNPRFVFFQISGGEPRGSLNEPVIPMRTIATDKSIYPRASLAFISTRLPKVIEGQPKITAYTGFVLDQDTGGAIRAPGRCDVYMGKGEMAGKLAGQVYQEGRLYYLFLKSNTINNDI